MRRPNVYFTTYADGSFERRLKKRILLLRLFLRPKDCFIYNREKLEETSFYESNKDILDERRGAGYWLWKPFIIYEGLNRIQDGDCLVYYDSGIRREYLIWSSLNTLINWAVSTPSGIFPGIMIPECGPNSLWTKRDAFILMGVDDMDRVKYLPQIQATYSVWIKTKESMEFVEEWLNYAQDRRIITDDANTLGRENYDGFIEHRHDQSILTNLVHKYQIRTINHDRLPVFRSKSIAISNLYLKEEKTIFDKLILVLFRLWFARERPSPAKARSSDSARE